MAKTSVTLLRPIQPAKYDKWGWLEANYSWATPRNYLQGIGNPKTGHHIFLSSTKGDENIRPRKLSRSA